MTVLATPEFKLLIPPVYIGLWLASCWAHIRADLTEPRRVAYVRLGPTGQPE